MIVSLNDAWVMRDGEKSYPCAVPCSAYHTLLQAGAIPDPYWGENECISTAVSDRDFSFEKRFDLPNHLLSADRVILTLEGVDTLADVYLNGCLLGKTDNTPGRRETCCALISTPPAGM
ncbi:MAG: hypothetical protein IJ662_06525 [Clostridia bacterium]|nr:hypothetical protein [Clostridia bacterium]